MENGHDDLISVVIPSYNRANTIVRCLDSILSQTYKNIEIIIVDDCSTDNTAEVIKKYNSPNVFYYKLDRNRRACYARNFGAKKAMGKYIAFQDSDDVWHPDKLEKELELLKSENVDFVFCGMNKIGSTGNEYFPIQRDIDTKKDFFWQELRWNAVSTQTILMKKEVIESVQFDESLKKYQDWDFAIRVAQQFSIAYLPEPLVDYYIQENSVSVTVNHFDSINIIYSKYYEYIKQNKRLNAHYLTHFGDCFRKTDSPRARNYYLQSLKLSFNVLVFAKYIVALFGIKI